MDNGNESSNLLNSKRSNLKIFKENSILPYNVKKLASLHFLNEKYELLPQSSNNNSVDNKRFKDLFPNDPNLFCQNPNNQSSNPTFQVFCSDTKNEEKTNEEKLKRLIIEKNIVIREIQNIRAEIQVFEQREKRDRMIILMEKIAENINEDQFEIEDLKDMYIFGEKMSDIESKYLENMKKIQKNNLNKIFTNSKKKDDKLFVTKNLRVFDFNKLIMKLKKGRKVKIKKRKSKKYKKSCFSCFIADENLSLCENCTAAYHTYCESFKAIYIIDQKLTIVVCNECFSLYRDNNKLLKEQSSLYDNCEFQIRTNDLKLRYRCPKFYSTESETYLVKNDEQNEMTVLSKNLFKFYQDNKNKSSS
jgi:hypothetical protein